jgi:hypothetical protein
MLACRSLGHVISEAFASLVASTIVNPDSGNFYVERPPIDEGDAIALIADAAKRIQQKDPYMDSLRLQAAYESAFADAELLAKRQKISAKETEDKVTGFISGFSAKFDQDFDTLTGLYKKIYQFLMLRCTGPVSSTRAPSDPQIGKEVAAALESVFPRVGLRAFVALTGAERAAQLQELSGIVLGIRLFNQHQKKGGMGLPVVEGAAERLQAAELCDTVRKEVDEVSELCKNQQDAILTASKGTASGVAKPTAAEIDKARSDLLYLRQYLCYLLNLLEDMGGCIDRLKRDQRNLSEELVQLDALVGGRVSVPKEQVYPRFDAVSRVYRTAWMELHAIEARKRLYGVLKESRAAHFPQLSDSLKNILALVPEGQDTLKDETAADDKTIQQALNDMPGPHEEDGSQVAVRHTADNSTDFLQVPLDFQGFCIHTLVNQNALLVPGNPALGVIKFAGRYCVFATESAIVEFAKQPDKYFVDVRNLCYKNPELIHLLRVHEDFPRSSLPSLLQMTLGSGVTMKADVGTATPLHFEESNIDKKYEWNAWNLRKDALHMADICKKSTTCTQTNQSHLRRENETQVYLPREVATNTAVHRGTNPPRWRKYLVGVRGEPQAMQVSEVKFDL